MAEPAREFARANEPGSRRPRGAIVGAGFGGLFAADALGVERFREALLKKTLSGRVAEDVESADESGVSGTLDERG